MGYRIYNEDCFSFMQELITANQKVDLIHIDPPYNIETKKGGGSVNKANRYDNQFNEINNLNISNGYNIRAFGELVKKLQDKINIQIWCNKKQLLEYFDFYVKENDCLFEIFTWHKTNPVPAYNNKCLNDTEFCLYFKQKGAYHKPQKYEDGLTFFIGGTNKTDKVKYKHPTIKPLEFTERLIKNSCPEDGFVLDCFMGSGTTGKACILNNRNFIGVEINKRYYDIAKERLNTIFTPMEE